MTQEGTKRKLTAILSADVKEYSRLMSQDERGTIRTLTAYREAMSKLIQEYKGRVVDSPGDNLLAEFGSVVDAVNCAVEIQRELAERNAELPPARQMEFRIGINLGDVVEEEGRIYGDGVNIAARLESLAEGGGICISGKVHKEVKTRLGLEYEYLGEQTVKNITEPVEVYRVLSFPGAAAHRVIKAKSLTERKWLKGAIASTVVLVLGVVILAIWNFHFRPPPMEPASEEKMAYPLPEKPSIAVLPFTNMSEDPKQEYFSDGITEEIITALSKTPKMLVIARNSTFTYKGKAVKVNQVAEELGVRYVLEGSVRKVGDRVRISAQLIDALTGHHLWAERYDRDLKDVFALQDEITIKIIGALQVELTDGELARFAAKGTENLAAYLKLLQAREQIYTITEEGMAQARRLCEEAIALDPEYAPAYVYLGATHWMDISLGASKSPKESLKRAFEFIKKAKILDDSLPEAHSQLSWLYMMTRQYDKSIAECERAITLAPNSGQAHMWMGLALKFAGRHEEALQYSERALRLDPLPPPWYFRAMGSAYSWVGRYEEAIAFAKKALQRTPNDLLSHGTLIVAYSWADRLGEARAQVDEVLRINPKFCIEKAAKTFRYKNKADQDRFLNALRKAGLPETPPLHLPDKPSIAVLSFTNMSEDPKQEYFSDGITEEIITALSKTPKLFVIARNSTFTYKGKPVKVQQVGRELGVKYVLEGSVRQAGDKVRITAQLVDAKTGNHIWAERYDRDLKDIFAIQDEITKKIITSLQVTLTEGEQARIYSRGTNNLQAYLKILKGIGQGETYTKESNALARQTFEEAITLDPQYAFAYYALGLTHWGDVVYGLTSTPKKSIAKAIELTQKAITLDDSLGEAHGFLANLFKTIDQHDKAIALAERGVALNPNSAATYFWFGLALNYSAGNHEEAIAAFKKAIRLNPMPGLDNLIWLAIACRDAGRYDEAISLCEKIHNKMPHYIFAHTCLASCYALMGRLEEAHAEAEKVLRINPKFSVDYIVRVAHYKHEVDRKRLRDSLLKAGLPE